MGALLNRCLRNRKDDYVITIEKKRLQELLGEIIEDNQFFKMDVDVIKAEVLSERKLNRLRPGFEFRIELNLVDREHVVSVGHSWWRRAYAKDFEICEQENSGIASGFSKSLHCQYCESEIGKRAGEDVSQRSEKRGQPCLASLRKKTKGQEEFDPEVKVFNRLAFTAGESPLKRRCESLLLWS